MANNPDRAQDAKRAAWYNPNSFAPIGPHLQDTTISSATVLAPSTVGLASDEMEDQVNCILLQCLTRDVRYTLDGTTPTSSVGFVLSAGSPPMLIYITPGVVVTVIESIATASVEFQFGHVTGDV